MASEIWLSDMSRCLPGHALSTKRRKYHWQLIEYEAEGGLEGVMLSAGPETEAPDIIHPLNLSGWHTIHIGLWGGPRDVESRVKLRLKDDPCFTTLTRQEISPSMFTSLTTLEDAFWKHADLTDQHLVIGQQSSGFKHNAFLAYIRLTPLSDEELSRLQRDRVNQDTRRLIAANDAGSDLGHKRSTTKEDILEMVEPYRDTDFKKLFWEVGSGWTSLGGKFGPLIGEGCEDFLTVGNRYWAESLQILHSKGIDPLKTAMEHAHNIGLEFHVSQRVEAFQMAPPWEELLTTVGDTWRKNGGYDALNRT